MSLHFSLRRLSPRELTQLRPQRFRSLCNTPFLLNAATQPLGASTPVLSNLRNDLKAAMKSKNSPRLAVVRSLLASITNASKTNSPITTDVHLLQQIKRDIASREQSAEEFSKAGRPEMAEKENAQKDVLVTYASAIREGMAGPDDIRKAVREVLDALNASGEKAQMKSVMDGVLKGSALEGKMVDRGEVAKIAKEELGQ